MSADHIADMAAWLRLKAEHCRALALVLETIDHLPADCRAVAAAAAMTAHLAGLEEGHEEGRKEAHATMASHLRHKVSPERIDDLLCACVRDGVKGRGVVKVLHDAGVSKHEAERWAALPYFRQRKRRADAP